MLTEAGRRRLDDWGDLLLSGLTQEKLYPFPVVSQMQLRGRMKHKQFRNANLRSDDRGQMRSGQCPDVKS
jgi:hypothetical protein